MHKLYEIISRDEICSRFNIHKDTLKRWIKNRNFPKPIKASGRTPLFSIKNINEWFRNMEREND